MEKKGKKKEKKRRKWKSEKKWKKRKGGRFKVLEAKFWKKRLTRGHPKCMIQKITRPHPPPKFVFSFKSRRIIPCSSKEKKNQFLKNKLIICRVRRNAISSEMFYISSKMNEISSNKFEILAKCSNFWAKCLRFWVK